MHLIPLVFLYLWIIVRPINAQSVLWDYAMDGGTTNSDWVTQSGSYTAVTGDTNCPVLLTACWKMEGSGTNSITRNVSTLSLTNIELTYSMRTIGLSANERCFVEYSIDGSVWTVIQEAKSPDIDETNTVNTWVPSADNQPELIIKLRNGNLNDGYQCYFAQFRLTATGMATANPSRNPSRNPTRYPTRYPTRNPTGNPTDAPTDITLSPTHAPSAAPSQPPTMAPSTSPTASPSTAPSKSPVPIPTKSPTLMPSKTPSKSPTKAPVPAPTDLPTAAPSSIPTAAPSNAPSSTPTRAPTEDPIAAPSSAPTATPTDAPSIAPSLAPSEVPTATPSNAPTTAPTNAPTTNPTAPTVNPTMTPSFAPTDAPSIVPTHTPTVAPSVAPSDAPSVAPTRVPTHAPSVAPSAPPTSAPTDVPTYSPTLAPTYSPSAPPSSAPSKTPTRAPTDSPTPAPTFYPTVPPTTRVLPPLHLNQYGMDELDLLSLIDMESKARWRKLLMLATSDTLVSTPITDKLYVDVFINPQFEVDLAFDCTVEPSYTQCALHDIDIIKHKFGDLFGLKYFASTSLQCVFASQTVTLTITISLAQYDTAHSVASLAAAQATITAMEGILTDIGNIRTASFADRTEHTRLQSVVISWESYDYDSTYFAEYIRLHEDAFKNNIATQIDIAGFSGTDVDIIGAEEGALPIDIIPDNRLCDSDRDFSAFPTFTSKLVGSGNVVQIDFDRPTNLGHNAGNHNLGDVVVNYISSSLNYSVGSWQDPSTLLLFIGYGPSTISPASQYSVKDCVRDACYGSDTVCNDELHKTSTHLEEEYTEVVESRISGATYMSSTCPLVLFGGMSIGPLGVFGQSSQNREYPIYSWSVFAQGTVIIDAYIGISTVDISNTQSLYSDGDLLDVSLTTTWAQGREAYANITVEISTQSTAPAITVNGGLIHYVQYEAGEYVTLSIRYSLCGSVTDDKDVAIVWKEVTPSAAQSARHGIDYSSASIPSSIDTEVVMATDVTDLVLSMDALNPYHVYYYKVSVGSSSEYIQLEVMPPLIINTGGETKAAISIQEDAWLSIKHMFVFPNYLQNDALTTYYSWSWSCVHPSDDTACEDEFVPSDNAIDIHIENGLLRGNQEYVYTVILNDLIYGITTTSTYTWVTASMQHMQIGITNAPSNRNMNPLFQRFTASVDAIASVVSQQWKTPSYNLHCDAGQLSTYDTLFSFNVMNASSCDLSYGSIQNMRYDATVEEANSDSWPNVASVEFNVYINIPPFGGECRSNLHEGHTLSTPFSIECTNWMYTHTADINYYHQTTETSYLRYTLRLVAPSFMDECHSLLHRVRDVRTRYSVTYSDIQSTCIGIVLSYDKYSGTMHDLYLGTGDHTLISEIEDRITGAKASFVLKPIHVTPGASFIMDIVRVWFDRYNSQKVFSFMMSLCYSLNNTASSTTLLEPVRQLLDWDTTVTKHSTNLNASATQFYQRLKTMNMVTPKVVTQYFDTLYCIVVVHLRAESDDDMNVIHAWRGTIEAVYAEFIDFYADTNIQYETALKALEMVQILVHKLMDLTSDSEYVTTLYSLFKLANKIGYNSLYDAIPSQYISFSLSHLSMALTKTTRNQLSRCSDLSMDIQWPSDWAHNTTTTRDESHVLCIMITMDSGVSIGAATDHINILSVIDIDLSDRYSLVPLQLSMDDIANEEHNCNSISFKIPANHAFTANFTERESYVTPKCVSVDIYSEDTEFNWNETNCEVETYNARHVRCACAVVEGTLFTLQSNAYTLGYEFYTETDVKGLTGINLAQHPTALIVMILIVVAYAIGFYWIRQHDTSMHHIPLLARPDIVFRLTRDEYFANSSLGQLLGALYAPHLTMPSKLKEAFQISMCDYHLLLSMFLSNPYTNVATILRFTVFMMYVLSVLWLSAYFYGTNDQAHWAAALCVGDTNYKRYDGSLFCSDVAMAFVYSLCACIPCYFFLGWIALIRPYTMHWEDSSMDSILNRVKERSPLWEMRTILNIAKAIYDEAQDIRSKFFFSGQAKQHHAGLAIMEDDDYIDPNNHVSTPADHIWSGNFKPDKDSSMPYAHMETFRRNVGDMADDLQNMEHDILNDMMNPSQVSMNAPKPMYDEYDPNRSNRISDNGSRSPDSNQPFIHPMEVVIPPVFDDKTGNAHHEDDEKDILLGITPGGMAPAHDEWSTWQPVTEQERDLQFEIAAGLMDKSGIDMPKAMEKARKKLIHMKKHNQAMEMPQDLRQRVGSIERGIGPAAQSASRKKAKERRKQQKLQNRPPQPAPVNAVMNDDDNNNIDTQDDAYLMQAKIMAQIQSKNAPNSVEDDFENNQVVIPPMNPMMIPPMKEPEIPNYHPQVPIPPMDAPQLQNDSHQAMIASNPAPMDIPMPQAKQMKVTISLVEPEVDEVDPEENARNKEKMEKMEDMACRLRETELTRRRLLFTEYPFPTNCMGCCVITLILYCVVLSLFIIYYGLSFDSNRSTIDLSFNPIASDASSSRRLLQTQMSWSDIHWNETLYDESGDCAFVPMYGRIQHELEGLMSMLSDHGSASTLSEDARWILFSLVTLLIGFLIWQPFIAFIIGAIWLFIPQYNGQIISNMLCCNLIYVYKSIACRQLLYLCCNREYVEHHIMDSLILVTDDKKGNEHRLQKRQRYYVSLNVNGDIIDYGQEFNEIFKEWEFRNKKHHKSDSSSFAQKMHHSYQASIASIENDAGGHHKQFDSGNISDDMDDWSQDPFGGGAKKKKNIFKKKRANKPPPVERLKSDIEIAYAHDENEEAQTRVSGKGRTSALTLAPKQALSLGVHSGDMSVLHLFAIEHGISGQVNIGASSPEVHVQSNSPQNTPQMRYSAKDYTNVASIDFVKHSKKQSFFYIVEAEYFPSTYLNVNCNDILEYCPLHPMKQSLFGQQEEFKSQPPPQAAAVEEEAPQVQAYGGLDEEEQMRLAIQQSLMEQEKEKEKESVNPIANEQRIEMMQPHAMMINEMDPLQEAMNDPSLQNLEPNQRRKVMKQRLKAQEELAFQDSIKHLSEYERQQAIYERIQTKNKKKEDKQKRRAKMLNDPTANQVAQQHAILAQIEAQKAKQASSIQQAPMAFQYQ